ncbi:hypothetical protein BAUCODRAFT_571748 [Baudoinia panamericana UAMH 10762]|uniref:K Homology domain-containing protein n=1 Tax=Baudoinia panamericana (strain UAMH 10762) TaxID=717646 RepID=M2NJK3_BAUPA|nr:uncharacterized protein BAUCODRAFT_571748 [Baudoinia panamericana UAMH 10762]EMC99579.1 hypothetical protein BAUCODRAFT_571748 [Baudoinia panamericana UAMH 10762]
MASDTANGVATLGEELSPAQKLLQEHQKEQEMHHAYVEDDPDESGAAKATAPAAAPSVPAPTDSSGANAPSAEPVMSSKAAGKQPMREEQTTAGASKPRIDTASEEAFPALSAPKAQAAAAPNMWSKKPAAVGKAANGMANGAPNGNSASNLPGRQKEQIVLPISMMTPRNQLKKPMPDIIRDINKRSKATIAYRPGPAGNLIFEGTGPTDAVRTSLKEVVNQLCSNQKVQVPIPVSVRGRVVGKQGATIQAISKKTGAKINISKQEAAELLEEDDATVDVTIEGDPFAVQMARQDIEKIVAEHTSTINSKLKHIPAEYYPFLASQQQARMNALRQQGQNINMQIPQYHTWSQQAPEVPGNRQPVSFAPQPDLPIQLSGDRQAVAEARAEIERQVQELQRQLTLEQMALERGRHQFIVGEMGTDLQNFLRETGCSIILPPDHDESEMITIVGPPDKIEEAVNKVYDLASAMQSSNADISKQFANAPRGAQAHVRDMTRYLQQRQALAEIERMHNARIVPDSTGNWQIYARDPKSMMKARADLMNLVSGHPPTRFQPVDVDPYFHSHLREQAAPRIRDEHGVHVIVPDDDDSPVLLVFEDRAPAPDYDLPRRQPTSQDVQAFQQALEEAQQQIINLMNGHQEIVSRDVEAPVKFHDKIRRHVDRHHSALPEGQIPVQVNYGGMRQAGQRGGQVPNVSLRGPQDFVDALNESLLAFVAQEEQDELERGFTLTFEFPQQYANHLIGRKGENINRLREEFDVDIQVSDGQCTIKGPEAKANACKKHILEMAKKLQDETTHNLNIPQQYHRDLIGPGGSQIHRLQDRYGVHVNFPRTRQTGDEEGGDNRRSHQEPHIVVVKGPSKGADACRDELLSLLQYVKDNSFTTTVSVAQSLLPSLIGSGGKEMEAMRLESGAHIDVPNSREIGSDGRAEIKIKGSKQAVETAKKIIESKSKAFDDTVTRNMDVDRRHHRLIIGPQGSTLRNIISQAGGPDDPRMHNRMIRFPKTDADGNNIRLEGQKAVIDQICAAIEALVQEQESQTTDVAEVHPDKHRLLIGRGGETRRQLEQQFGVSINVPRQTDTGPQRSHVRIAGQAENVERAKAHILDITKDQEGETINVPRRFHHSIADNGQFFRRLRNDHKVTVDHAGQRPPPKPSTPTPNRNADGGDMPLITDDPSANTNSHSWETHNLHSSAEDGEIPWVLSGPSPEAIAAARAKLDRAMEEAGRQDTVGFLILPDPRAYRHVIGPGGSVINGIRKETGTKIQVPKDSSKGEAIEITGDKAGVEGARERILEAIAQGMQ